MSLLEYIITIYIKKKTKINVFSTETLFLQKLK
jgi:hypothetical protein